MKPLFILCILCILLAPSNASADTIPGRVTWAGPVRSDRTQYVCYNRTDYPAWSWTCLPVWVGALPYSRGQTINIYRNCTRGNICRPAGLGHR